MHLLQIWIVPEKRGLTPSYEEKSFDREEQRGRLRLIGSRDGRDGSVTIHQDVSLYAALLDAGQSVEHPLAEKRATWLQVASGSVEVNGQRLDAGDAIAVADTGAVAIKAKSSAEVLLFDLPRPN